MSVFLERFLLVLCGGIFLAYVINNGMQLDVYQRVALGMVLIGAAYLIASAVDRSKAPAQPEAAEQATQQNPQDSRLEIEIRPNGFPEIYLTDRINESASALPYLHVIVLPNVTIISRENRRIVLRCHLRIQTEQNVYEMITDPDVPAFPGWKAERRNRTNGEAAFLKQPITIVGPGVVRGDMAFTAGGGFERSLRDSPYWEGGRFNISLYVVEELSKQDARIDMGWLLPHLLYDIRTQTPPDPATQN